MTYNNGNSNDHWRERLDRFERGLEETRQLVESNARAIQALVDQSAGARATTERLAELTEAVVAMLARQDETNPTILARLNRIEGKVDQLLEGQQPPPQE
jgi:hypothetical protein